MSTGRALASAPVADDLAATKPPEARGLSRDEVRLMVAGVDSFDHVRFRDVGDFLLPGDLLVVNTSATIPAAIPARRKGVPIRVHLSSALDDGTWLIELRSQDGSRPLRDGRSGEIIEIPGHGRIVILSPAAGIEGHSRMLRARIEVAGTVPQLLERIGRPISYSYVTGTWPLAMYQTVFGREPGSAEMPSAARPFSTDLVTDLVGRGIVFAPLVLHAGVSSQEGGETPMPEPFRIPEWTARFVNSARAGGRRVIAVGTTVTRALESAASETGFVRPMEGWTDLVLSADGPIRVVDGLISGWHAPEASHRALLEAVAGSDRVARAHEIALEERYLWHEFGDACLFLPEETRQAA